MRAWICALALGCLGAVATLAGPPVLAQQPATMTADEAYVRAVAYMQGEFAKLHSESAETRARLAAAESELKRLRNEAKAKDATAQTALTAFAAGDGEKGVDALIADANAKAKASAEDFKRAGALAFAIDTNRAITAFEGAARLAPNDMWTLVQLEWLYERVGRYEEALTLARRLAASSDPESRARGLVGECTILFKRSAFTAAKTACLTALDFAVKAGVKGSEADAVNALGAVAKGLGDDASAKTYFERALAISVAQKDMGGEATFSGNLAQIARKEGDLVKAEAYARRALALDEKLGFTSDKAATLIDLGNISVERKDLTAAEAFFKEALTLGEQLNHKVVQATALANLGQMASRRDDLVTAESYSLRALKIDEELGWAEDKAITLLDLGVYAKRRGDIPKACDYFRQSLATFEGMGSANADFPRRNIAQTCPH